MRSDRGEHGDVIQVTSSVVYTLTLADSSCATTFIAAAALQVCRRHLTIRSSTPNSLATIRVENDQDDGSGHRVLWVGAGASLTSWTSCSPAGAAS